MSTLKSSDVQMDDLLELAVQETASDLHLAVGLPPVMRIHGSLAPLDAEPLKPEDTDRLMRSITPEHHLQALETGHGADFGFSYKDVARFRVSVVRVDSKVVYLMANPAGTADFTDEAWSAVSRRAALRATQLP